MSRLQEKEQEFRTFVRRVEPRLVEALVASYGPYDGRVAAADALSWAWEHWDQAVALTNPGPYLFRVGQSSVRRNASRPVPSELLQRVEEIPELTPELVPALARLSVLQRTVVVLVHGYGWTQRDVATLLETTPSTIHDHLNRATELLRADLEVDDAH